LAPPHGIETDKTLVERLWLSCITSRHVSQPVQPRGVPSGRGKSTNQTVGPIGGPADFFRQAAILSNRTSTASAALNNDPLRARPQSDAGQNADFSVECDNHTIARGTGLPLEFLSTEDSKN
jgi:hypothetical protein